MTVVEHFKPYAEEDGKHTERCEYQHRHTVAARSVESFADKQGHKAEAYILNPEDKTVSRTEDVGIDDFGH